MLFLVLLPAIPAIWLVSRRSVESALLNVYLPVLFLVPTYYIFEVPSVLGFCAADAAIIPIAAAAIYRYHQRWRWRRVDLWLLLFAAAFGYSMAYNYSMGLRAFFQMAIAAILPYVVGKLMIEQVGFRERFVRRMAWLAAIVAFLSLPEFRLGKNLFTTSYATLFHRGSPNIEQVRHFYTRVQGPFEHAIAAGMVFFLVWIFALWQSHADKRNFGASEPRMFRMRRSWLLMAFSFLGLFMTNSRGPWLGAIAAYGIYRIGIATNVKRTAMIVALLGIVLGGATYSYLKFYTSGTIQEAANHEQENAVYRRQLLDNYMPIAESGGLFGWGLAYPRVPGQGSIDDHYLLLWLMQGLVGVGLFSLIGVESIYALTRRARTQSDKDDFSLTLSLLAVIAGFLLTLATVALQAQALALYYICIGWSMAVPAEHREPLLQPEIPEEPAELTGTRIFA